MALFIDRKFIFLVSPKLERFKQKSNDLFNMRCPYCGDSKKNKIKSRGYVYRKKNDLFFMCHNCGTSTSFGKFLKSIDPSLYKEYQIERYKHDNHSNVKLPDFSLAKEKPVFNTIKEIKLPTIQSLPDNHIAKQFLIKRGLSTDLFSKLYFAEDFAQFAVEFDPTKKLMKCDKRIVIPFFDEKNILLGFQGRAIQESEVKYITIKLEETNRKIFGLNTVDYNKKVYIVEGPIDSLFLQNSLAMMDAALYSTKIDAAECVYVWDNEPRNKEIVKHMNKAIQFGKNICIWPNDMKEKDINDMVIAGYSPSVIQAIIDKNTYDGVRAKLEFERWKKI